MQKHNVDDLVKTSKKKKTKVVPKSKTWLEDAMQAMKTNVDESSHHESEEQEEEQDEVNSSSESQKSLESLIDAYASHEEDLILQYKFEEQDTKDLSQLKTKLHA